MLFSSMTFLGVFLPAVCLAYFLAKPAVRNYILLAASFLFYAWGGIHYLAIMILTIVVNYVGAVLLDKYKRQKKLILLMTVLANLAFLVYFKYFNFIIDNINGIFSAEMSFIKVVMPIGISFYTFQAMSYLIDVYREEVPAQRDIYKLSLYIALFPQLVAGPIVKYHDVDKQIDERTVNFEKVAYGVKRFIIGLAKKVLIANTLGAVADKIFTQQVSSFDTVTSWIGAVAYSLQLYYDFSGYSDMAIGLGMIFGFRFMENFNYPYISKSITEFWRRWHISLSTWFKEYLYIPLGGNRKSPLRTYFNLFVVFFVTGLWHGASWSFVVWGLWHGLFMILERRTGFTKNSGGLIKSIVSHVYVFLVFVIGWVIFRADSLSYAVDYIRNMFGLISEHKITFGMMYYVDTIEVIAFVFGAVCSVPVFKAILEIKPEKKVLRAALNGLLLMLFVLSAASIASSTYNPFIYFRF
ncbi:MAG TPA: MBOAT family protein [Spirochaetota bacterium]|nr:MBOAT family protein [Spirochaetota bacterium]